MKGEKQAQKNIMDITQRKALSLTSKEVLKNELEWVNG